MSEKIGIITFSFALTKEEMEKKSPNQCDKTLARESRVIYRKVMKGGGYPILAVQWEIALDEMFEKVKIIPDFVITKHREEGKYLDSEEIVAQATIFFKKLGIKKVYSVAQWLQNFKCRALLKKEGFQVLPLKIGKIGFCKDSLQWWTRGPIRLVIYTIKQILFGHRGR